ncbi:MAG TPA: hypothetical protein VGI75_02050, partial [Pirellulales bacterium]
MADDNLPPLTANGEYTVSGDARLQNLLEKICDQSADAEEASELNAILTNAKSARDYYLRYLSLHSS